MPAPPACQERAASLASRGDYTAYYTGTVRCLVMSAFTERDENIEKCQCVIRFWKNSISFADFSLQYFDQPTTQEVHIFFSYSL